MDTPSVVVEDLPFEIREYVIHYLQEQLYVQALEQLQSVLLAGADLSEGVRRRIFIPSAQIIATLCTLIVYPPWTSRLPITSSPDAANSALHYIRQLSSSGVTTALPITEAFSFQSGEAGRPSRRRRSLSGQETAMNKADLNGKLTTRIANADLLFSRADDFWAVVGWAFNCSVKHPRRWERWQLWLELILDILEKDLNDRTKASDAAADSDAAVQDALLTKYLSLRSQGRTEKRRMMRAILADGTKQSLAEFGPLWRNETLPPKELDYSAMTTKRLDIENEQFGDYMDLDEEEETESDANRTSRSRRRGTSEQPQADADEHTSDSDDEAQAVNDADFGGQSSVKLRQRLMGLLAQYCLLFPKRFVDLEDLFDIYTEFLRPLPLNVFQQFVLPQNRYMDDGSFSELVRMLLRPLLSSEATVFREGLLKQVDLEAHFLPFAANRDNSTDNAKVGLLIEALTRMLWKHTNLEGTPSFRKALETGCEARWRKADTYGRKKTKATMEVDESAKGVLRQSQKRMELLLDLVEHSDDPGSQ